MTLWMFVGYTAISVTVSLFVWWVWCLTTIKDADHRRFALNEPLYLFNKIRRLLTRKK